MPSNPPDANMRTRCDEESKRLNINIRPDTSVEFKVMSNVPSSRVVNHSLAGSQW